MIPVDGRYFHVGGGLALPEMVPTDDASPDGVWSWWVSQARSGALILSLATKADVVDTHSCEEYRRFLVSP